VSLLTSALVIARRDYFATVMSRTFLLFLLGPLLPIVFAIAYAGLAGHAGPDEPVRPLVALAMDGAANDAVMAAAGRIERQLSSDVPTLTQADARRPTAALADRGAVAVLAGTLDAPVIEGPHQAVKDVVGPLTLVLDDARREAALSHAGADVLSVKPVIRIVAPPPHKPGKSDGGERAVARTGRRMRVATKYLVQTRAFFARHGLADYRITESGGATEGAPAAGAAELIVDITTTGATLAANGLKILSDGLILSSQAQFAASLRSVWTPAHLDTAERVLRIIEARATAHESATLVWPQSEAESAAVVDRLVKNGAVRRPNGLLVAAKDVAQASLNLTAAGLGPVTASRPDFVFDQICEPVVQLRTKTAQN